MRVHRQRLGRHVRPERGDRVRILPQLLDVHHAHGVAVLHREVVLRRDDEIRVAGDRDLGPAVEPRHAGRPQSEHIVSDARAGAPGAAPAVPEIHDDGIVGRAGQDPDGQPGAAALIANLENVLVLVARTRDRNVETLGCPRADVRDVVPRDLRQRPRQFLQPAVVRVAAVEDVRIGPEDDLHARRDRRRHGRHRGSRRRRNGGRRCRAANGCGRRWSRWRRRRKPRRARDETVVERVAPEHVGIEERLAAGVAKRPGGLRLTGERACPVPLDEVHAARRYCR